MNLNKAEKLELLKRARACIGRELGVKESGAIGDSSVALKERCGAFVTLHLHGDLRGCIGYIEAHLPLVETIEDAAVKAAFDDPRFLPLTPNEFKEIQIEISVLSPLQKVTDASEIIVGKHGLVIDAGYTRGLLLPQVATEYGWDRDQFLSQTCRKAGLPADAWRKKGVTIYSFTSEVFSEAQFGGNLN